MIRISSMLFAVIGSAALAAEPPRRGPMGPGAGPGMTMRFDPQTIETLEGTIEKVLAGQGGLRMQGIHLLLKTASGTVEVHLGPSWFLERQETRLQAGDSVSVRGARIVVGDQPALIAIDVKRGGQTLQLRREDGTPLWAPGPRAAR